MKYPYPQPSSSAMRSFHRITPSTSSVARNLKHDWYREKSLEMLDNQVRYQRRMDQFKERARLMRMQAQAKR